MTKKLYIASDIHEDTEALAAFTDYAQAQSADRILLLGDLSLRPYQRSDLEALAQNQTSAGVRDFIAAKNKHDAKNTSAMKQILDGSGIPYNVIGGNYDAPLGDAFGDHDLHLRTTQFEEAKVAGYGGADAFPPHIQLLVQLGQILPFDHEGLYTFLTEEKPDIGVIHNPPLQFCDDMFNGRNVGTFATTQYMQQNEPKLIMSGHIHEAGPNGNNPRGVAGIATLEHPSTGNKTIIVNPGNLGRFELLNQHTLETEMDFDHGTFSEVEIEADGTPVSVTHFSLQPQEQKGKRDIERTIGPVRRLVKHTL